VNRLRAVIERLDIVSSPGSTEAVHNRSATWRPVPPSPWENYSASVYLPATNPTPRVLDWANAHTEADQQLRLVGDLFDLIQREVEIMKITNLLGYIYR